MSELEEQPDRGAADQPRRGEGADEATFEVSVGGADVSIRVSVAGAATASDAARRPAPSTTDGGWLSSVLDITSDLVAAVRPDGQVVFANPTARRFRGLGPTDAVDQVEGESLLTPESLALWDSSVAPIIDAGGVWRGEVDAIDLDDQPVPLEIEVIAHRDDTGEVDVISVIGRDITQRKELESRLAHEASHDPLTGLPNRTLFLDRLHMSVARSRRTNRNVAVLFCDLDHFKLVNDQYGHEIGDQVLVALAERLGATIRPGDTVARLGGDEFVVLCEEVDRREEAQIIAQRIAAAVAEPAQVDGHRITITASIGVALADDPESAEALLRDADAAMYAAKDRGRGRTAVFDTQVRTRAVDRLALETDLRHALVDDELSVYYQSLIDLRTGRVVGLEALLRWNHPERGLLRPSEFLPLAETTSSMVAIGRWLAREAVSAINRIEREVPGIAPLLVTVNLSPTQLVDPDLAADLEVALDEAGVSPARLEVEITEELFTDVVDITDATLARLGDLGVKLAVDDFGHGHTPLASVARYAVDLIKIDGDLVAALGTGEHESTVVAAVVDLAHSLGLRTVAENVETAGQLAELQRLGCDLAQGYFINQPQPIDELIASLAGDPVWWVFEPEGGAGRAGVWSGWLTDH